MLGKYPKLNSKAGFSIMEIMIAAAILMVISLGVSQVLVSSQRSMSKSDMYVIRQALEKYMSSMINSEKGRCNSIKSNGDAWKCAVDCQACLNGVGCSTGVGYSNGNCRDNTNWCNDGTVAAPVVHYMPLRSFNGDTTTAKWIVGNNTSGNRITDSGDQCGTGYATATTSCRWFATVGFLPDYNDAWRFYLTLQYQPNEADDPHKIPTRSWEIVVPTNELCSSL